MSRAWALGAALALYSAEIHAQGTAAAPDLLSPSAQPKPEHQPKMLALRLAPQWSFRRFVDSEASSTDKHYAATGILGMNMHADFCPFIRRADALANLGFLATYGQALGLKSTDIDTSPPSDVGTDWYQFDAGLQYRFPSSTRLSFTASMAYERWVFDFDDSENPPLREVPTARYSLARAGGDATFSLEWIRFLGQLQAMYPLSIAPLGDREPTAGGFGARAKLGVAIDLTSMLALDFGGAYTLFTFHLPSVPGRSDVPGHVLDQYFVTSLGLTLTL